MLDLGLIGLVYGTNLGEIEEDILFKSLLFAVNLIDIKEVDKSCLTFKPIILLKTKKLCSYFKWVSIWETFGAYLFNLVWLSLKGLLLLDLLLPIMC